MLTHIVFFRFKEADTAAEIRELLLSMRGQIPTLRELEAGVDTTRGARSFDLGLITRFDDLAGLDAYRVHPVHLKVLEAIKAVATEVAAVDFTEPR